VSESNSLPQASEVWAPPLSDVSDGGLARPRIGVGGISIESSTFSPHISGLDAFTRRRGEELLGYYGFLDPGDELREAAEWVPTLQARSLPGGAVDATTFRAMRDEIVERIRAAGPFDGFFFDIHGAMSVVGMDDAEADLAAHVRQALGGDALVSASMDLHGNVSRDLLDQVDLITCYRMAPHEDERNTRHRAVRNLLGLLRSADGRDPLARRPYKAWVQVPVLLPGEKTSTRIEPAKGLYAQVSEVERMPGVLDAAIWVGYAWADEPRCQAAVVVTGFEREVIAEQARRLAQAYWDARADFAFVADALQLDEALDAAVEAHGGPRPFVISDSGDNPTAGGAGDVSWTLARLLERPEFATGERTVVHAILTERRKPFHHRADFTVLGLEPEDVDVLVVKIGYLEPELYELARGWKLGLTPGGVDQDLLRLGHRRLAAGVYPFETGVLRGCAWQRRGVDRARSRRDVEIPREGEARRTRGAVDLRARTHHELRRRCERPTARPRRAPVDRSY
jgi:Uncharacterized conserved protein